MKRCAINESRLDANVFLSALIRDSATRRIIVSYGIEFYFPEPALNRIKNTKIMF